MNHYYLCLIVWFGLTPFTRVSGQEIIEYQAHYHASANGIRASAVRGLHVLEDESYELVNQLTASLLGQEVARLEQRSNFRWQVDHVQPQSYSYVLTGVGAETRTIGFNWETDIAVSVEDDESWTLALQGAVQDPLSYQFALSQALIGGANSDLEFQVIDGDEIELHNYQRVGEEVLATPLGKLNTVKFERRREDSSSRSTVIWLASDWHFLLARIEQVNSSGLHIELELERADISGAAVQPLPTAP